MYMFFLQQSNIYKDFLLSPIQLVGNNLHTWSLFIAQAHYYINYAAQTLNDLVKYKLLVYLLTQ